MNMSKSMIINKSQINANKTLIKYIYDTIGNISSYKYEILKYESQLNKLISSNINYYLAPNIYGKNCFLVFTKIGDKYYCFLVDKKQLSYDYDKLDFSKIMVYNYNVVVDPSIYEGTIFDGIQTKKNDNFEFIITDIYQFKGANCTNDKLRNKFFEVELYLKSINIHAKYNINKDRSKYTIDLKLTKHYDIFDINNFVKNTVKNYEKQYQIKGLVFYPEISGTKLIYLFEDNNIIEKTNQNQTQDFKINKSKALVKKEFISKTSNDIYATLEMCSTLQPDNYKLFALETIIVNSQTKLKKCQMNIAFIPDIKKSVWCREIMNSNKSVFVKCIWRHNKKKWEPLEVINDVKLPTLIDDIRKQLVEIEVDDTDSECD